MRLLYSVHGYGRGHAARALALLPALSRQHQIHILAGGDAYDTISQHYPVTRIPTLGFAYQHGQNRRSNWGTFRKNLPGILDACWRGPVFEMVQQYIESFSPDVIIADAETWTHRVAQHLRIPRISIDHFGILAYCHAPLTGIDWCKSFFDASTYRMMMGQPERVIISSFYPVQATRPGVTIVGTFCRPELKQLTPHHGEHLLVYLNRGDYQLTPRLQKALLAAQCPVHLYGCTQRGSMGNIQFREASNLPFLEDLANCRAVVSTAGNQLVGEAIYVGKPLLVMWEDCVEQRMNARAVERLQIGMCCHPDRISQAVMTKFLSQLGHFRQECLKHRHDGQQEAFEAIERYIQELVPHAVQDESPNHPMTRVA